MKFGSGTLILNVGGTRYSFPKDVIKDFPLRRVSRLHSCVSEKEVLEVCDDYDHERNEYFFDRHSEAFGFIMLYVKYGKLRFVPQMCELSFYNELIYWGLDRSHLEYCCQRRLDDRMSDTYTFYSEEKEELFCWRWLKDVIQDTERTPYSSSNSAMGSSTFILTVGLMLIQKMTHPTMQHASLLI